MIGGRVLDASALTDAATGRTIYARAFIQTAVELGLVLAVPTTALQDAWAALPHDDHGSLELVLGLPVTVVDTLTGDTARAAGTAGAAARGGQYATTPAHVVHSALTRQWPVLTHQPAPLEAINPQVYIERLPS
ncbi:MAG: hypothetical protein WAL50_07945 [Kineosporiaceae bacterium]